MKKSSVLIIVALTLAAGTGIGFLVASPNQDPKVETTVTTTEAPTVKTVTQESTIDPEGPSLPISTAAWAKTSHSFGEIQQNKPVTVKYEFTNTGKVDIVIQNVKASCGCTSPDWSKEPVEPGQKGFVTAEFNAAADGIFKKSVTVTMNTEPSITVLNFDGTVIK